jgi:hypothetical protein
MRDIGLPTILLAIVYAPFLITLAGEGGAWKFLAFVLCTIAIVLVGHSFLLALMAWLLAFACAAAARSAARKADRELAIFAEVRLPRKKEHARSHAGNETDSGDPVEPRSRRLVRRDRDIAKLRSWYG